MATVPEIIVAMQEAAPAGARNLAGATVAELQSLTQSLMSAMPDAGAELARFESIRRRCIAGDEDSELGAWLTGKSVLVTGGTGCVGSVLLAEVARQKPRRLVSVSRGVSTGWPRVAQAEYLRADITDRACLAELIGEVRPDVVFHLAAQRDPGLAERAVRRTVSTNVLGTRNVAEICAAAGVSDVISATSGKALRPYSREVYTAAKRAAEWLLARSAARSECRLSAVRFTHVVDNSILYRRLVGWTTDGIVRLHDPAVMFYAQSARESAQLMLAAGLRERQTGHPGDLRIYALNDLGFPVSLLDLAVGTLQRARSDSAIYFSGHDPGYESVPFPGLYDPATSTSLSPLLSAFEAIRMQPDPTLGIDACTPPPDLSRAGDDRLYELERACDATTDPDAIRRALDELSWRMFDATVAAVPLPNLLRIVRLTEPHEPALSHDHRKMLAVSRSFARAKQVSHLRRIAELRSDGQAASVSFRQHSPFG